MSPVSHGLRGGLVTGVALSVFGVVFNLTAAYTLPGVGMLFPALLLVLMAVALAKFTKAKGSRSYVEGLVIAVPLVIIAGLVHGISFFIWISFVDPEVLAFARSQAEGAAAGQALTAEEAEAQRKGFDLMFSAPVFTVLNFAFLTFVGIMGSFLVSLIGRRAAPAS